MAVSVLGIFFVSVCWVGMGDSQSSSPSSSGKGLLVVSAQNEVYIFFLSLKAKILLYLCAVWL